MRDKKKLKKTLSDLLCLAVAQSAVGNVIIIKSDLLGPSQKQVLVVIFTWFPGPHHSDADDEADTS